MTDFQAKQIRELRLRGAGYKSIASAVGLSRDTVRNYCKSHGLDGYASALVLNVKEQMESGTACLCCGKELIQPSTGRKRKFCSDKCRRYCSHECYVRDRFWRKEEGREPYVGPDDRKEVQA